jgi:BirA family biotin operon repressor/biotin-[acetyl-CoA-carboxylase] ligase
VRIDEIRKNLKRGSKREILFYETVGSTNSIALDLSGRTEEGSVILSDSQERGRGRLGRLWISPPGVNIYMSIVLKPGIKPSDATLITLMAGVACAVAIRKVTGLGVSIKWPNDLMASGKKLGGILTELKTDGKTIAVAVVGIGINVNMDMSELPGDIKKMATSFRNETGKIYHRESVVAEILNEIDRWYSNLKEMDREKILFSWRRLSSTLGREVMVVAGRKTCKGIAESIDDEGMLILRLPSGDIERISSGDLTILR